MLRPSADDAESSEDSANALRRQQRVVPWPMCLAQWLLALTFESKKDLKVRARDTSQSSELGAMVARKMGGQAAKTIEFSGKRKATANRLPHGGHPVVPAMITMQASMEEVMHHRQTFFVLTGVLTGEQILLSAYVVKAAAKALEDIRILDPSVKADAIPVHGGTNVAAAINTPDGLVAPVVSEANRKSVLELSREIQHLTDRAMKSGLTASGLAAGTLTVMNLGAFDIELFSPAIRPPQRVVLGFGQTSDRPVVIRKEIRIAATTSLSLAFDDKVVDGLKAAEFLQRVKDLLEDPSKLD